MTWSSLTELNDFLSLLYRYSSDLNSTFNTINTIRDESNSIESIIFYKNFTNIYNFNIKYILEPLNFKLYNTLINVKYDNLIKLKFDKYKKRILLLNGRGIVFYMGLIIDDEKTENSSLIITELVMNSIIDKLISYDNKNVLIKDIFKILKKNIIKKSHLRYYCFDLDLIKTIVDYGLSLKDKVEVIVKQEKIHEKKSRLVAKVPYLGDSEDTLPYLLQLPNILYSISEVDFAGLNIPIYQTRKGVHYCVLGWILNYLRNFDLCINKYTNEISFIVNNEHILISVEKIINILNIILKNIKKLYCKKTDIQEYNISELIKVEYTYASCLKFGTSSNICINFSSLWSQFDGCSKSKQNNLLKKINTTINNYNRNKLITIILFTEVIEITDKLGSIIKYTLEKISNKHVNIVLFNNEYSSEKEIFASEFLYRFCKPCTSYKNPKYLTHTFCIGSHEINQIHLDTICNYDSKLDYILELKNKFNEFICIKLFENLPKFKENNLLKSCKYLPCMKCKTIDTSKIITDESRQFLKCYICRDSLCLTCFNYHEGEHCSLTSIKKMLLRMVGENTTWYCGSSLITGLSLDALNDMMRNAFDKCNPDCFCEKCLSHHKLTYLESDRIACNHVICPNCRWSGCFMCGKNISSHNYTETHLIPLAYCEFMNEFCLIVKDEYIPSDKTEWRCYISVCSIFITDQFKIVDILWILLNLSTIPDYVNNKWKYVRKFILSMLFAPNPNNTDFKVIKFIESCRKATTFEEFYSIVLSVPEVYKISRPFESYSDTIRNGLLTIWENLFLRSQRNPYEAWANMSENGTWYIDVLRKFITSKCQ